MSKESAALLARALAGENLFIVRVEKVYGVDKIYPVSPAALAIAQIAGTKTITPDVLKIVREHLGFTVIEDPRPRLELNPDPHGPSATCACAPCVLARGRARRIP